MPNCASSERVLQQVEYIQNIRPCVSLSVHDQHPRFRTMILPALFIDDDLFSYGEIDQERLLCEIEKRMAIAQKDA